jgi:hypothetical protein
VNRNGVGWGGTIDMNMPEVSRAIEARETNFSRDTQRALEAAEKRAAIDQFKLRAWFGAAIVLVTTSGFFVAGRWFERERVKTA